MNRNTLHAAIEKCWDSLNQPRIIEYCRARNIDRNKVRIAVVVQKMIQPNTSGICFTVDPITAAQEKKVIEAVYDLKEYFVICLEAMRVSVFCPADPRFPGGRQDLYVSVP